MKKKRKRAPWQKKLNRALNKAIKEKQKTAAACEKIHRKAAKARIKKTEKNVDRLLIAGCFLICLTAAFKESLGHAKE